MSTSVVSAIERMYRERAEHYEALREAVAGPEPNIAEIESRCRAYLLTDHYRHGYENAHRILFPNEATEFIQSAKARANQKGVS